MNIRELQALAYKQSAEKGFHDNEPTEGRELLSLNAERIALMHSELSEALEELRSGRAANETYYHSWKLPYSLVAEVGTSKAQQLIDADNEGKPKKPEGVPSEMADVVIRVLDFCGANNIDLETIITEKLTYNATRGHMHGGKQF